MSDADLEEIRKARLLQLQQQGPANGQSGGIGGSGGGQDEQRKQQEGISSLKPLSNFPKPQLTPLPPPPESARSSLLSQILLPAAHDRLNRIRLVNAPRATSIEDRLITLAQTGQLRQKVTEEQLKELLGAVKEASEAREERIIVRRRGGGKRWDEESDSGEDDGGRGGGGTRKEDEDEDEDD
ncbi:hypothetical protein MMC16_006822 [Acarospora aff. strigata]|nr:hypothetical protein [Acarospora aff. strigata]